MRAPSGDHAQFPTDPAWPCRVSRLTRCSSALHSFISRLLRRVQAADRNEHHVVLSVASAISDAAHAEPESAATLAVLGQLYAEAKRNQEAKQSFQTAVAHMQDFNRTFPEKALEISTAYARFLNTQHAWKESCVYLSKMLPISQLPCVQPDTAHTYFSTYSEAASHAHDRKQAKALRAMAKALDLQAPPATPASAQTVDVLALQARR